MTHIYGFVNLKGGVGKTSTTLAIADYLSRYLNKRVLVVDADPQGNATSIYCHKELKELGRPFMKEETLYYTTVDNMPLSRHATHQDGVDIIPSSLDLFEGIIEVDRQDDSIADSKHTRLKKHLEDIKDDYDYILIDFCPSINILTYMAFTACHKVVIVSTPGEFETDGIQAISRVIERMQKDYNPGLQIAGILMNKVLMHRALSVDTINNIRIYFPQAELMNFTALEKDMKSGEMKEVVRYGVPDNSDTATAQKRKLTLFDWSPRSTSAKAIKALTEKYILAD